MKKSFKLVGCALMLGGLCTSEVVAQCPELTRDEIRKICRWGFLAKIPFLGIKAGTIEKNGVTLTNKLKTCGQKDSIEQFFKKSNSTTYPGALTKDPAEPSNPLKGLCTYTLGNQKIGFGVQFPPKPIEPPVAPQPTKKIIRGFDPTERKPEQGLQNVEVKKSPASVTPPSRVVPRPRPQAGEFQPVNPQPPMPQRNPTQPNRQSEPNERLQKRGAVYYGSSPLSEPSRRELPPVPSRHPPEPMYSEDE